MYTFFLMTEDGSESQTLPMNPESFEISCGADHERYSLMNIGEVISPGYAQCKTISFSSWLPFTSSPRNIIARWEGYMNSKRVLRLIIVGSMPSGREHFEINLPVIIQSLTTRDKGGEPGVVFFDVVFKEYRRFSLRVIS